MTIDLSGMPDTVRAKFDQIASYIDFERSINKGANGVVLIGHNKVLQRDVAVKFYYWGGGDHAEPALLAQMNSDNILKIFHAESIDNDFALFMTPYCRNGDLDDAMDKKKHGLIEALDITVQISSGVSYLHGSGYLHRDLKPPNILSLSANNYVIGDFGSVVAQNQEGFARTLTRHSLLYRPPEEISEKRSYRHGDVYQLGLILFQLLGGHLPYHEHAWLSEKQKEAYDRLPSPDNQFYASDIIENKICSGKLVDLKSLSPYVSKILLSVIKKCCNTSHAKRYESASDLSAKLNNIRKKIPDWRFDDHPTLHRKTKKYRIVDASGRVLIEKQVKAGWRTERSHSPANTAEAVNIAENL